MEDGVTINITDVLHLENMVHATFEFCLYVMK